MAEGEPRVVGQVTGTYSQGLVAPAGRLVFISGQVAMDAQGNLVGGDDMEAQARAAFEAIRALVEEAGGTLRNVVKITTYVKDMSRYAAVAKVRGEMFKPPYPASATVEISDLFKPGLLVEIEAVAVV